MSLPVRRVTPLIRQVWVSSGDKYREKPIRETCVASTSDLAFLKKRLIKGQRIPNTITQYLSEWLAEVS
jgi:hypothetical protein